MRHDPAVDKSRWVSGSVQTLLFLLIVTIGYAVAGYIGLRWATVDGVASPVWPAAGIGLAGLLLGGVRIWPAVFAGSVLAYWWADAAHPWWVELTLAAGNALAAASAAILLRRLGFDSSLRRTADIVALIGIGAASKAAIAASVATFTLWRSVPLTPTTAGEVWLTWWLGDATGVLIAAPLILAWVRRLPSEQWQWWVHFGSCLAATALAGWTMFISGLMHRPFTFYVLVPLVWAAVGFHVRGAAAAIVVVASIATFGSTSHTGPFADDAMSPVLRLLFLQQFVLIAAATTLVLAAVADERSGKEAVQASEERLRLYQDRMPIGCVIFSLDLTILDWNPACEKIFGYSRWEVLGKSAYDLIVPPESTEHVRTIQARLGDRDLEAHSVNENVRNDGRRIICEWHNTPLVDKEGRLVGILSMVQDVSDRVRSEEALRESDRRKDEFLAVLAHELRNPLAPISNALEAWPLVDDDPVRRGELRELMGRQVRQMSRLIDDLLDVSRISRGKITLRRERSKLSSILETAIEAIRPFVDARGHELSVELPAEPLCVVGDSGRLMQVFGNLIHNAAKYTDRNGSIWVTARRDGSQAIVSIRDNGPGIPTELLNQIFEMFAQVDQTLARSHGGLGIGLTLVKTLVEMHDGTVEAHSEGPGRGSEFLVRLPAEPTIDARASDEQSESKPGRLTLPLRRRVLVVDDMVPSAKTLAMMLTGLGQDTQTAFDGPSALKQAREFLPELCSLISQCPEWTGTNLRSGSGRWTSFIHT